MRFSKRFSIFFIALFSLAWGFSFPSEGLVQEGRQPNYFDAALPKAPESFISARHFYEIMPQTFFPEISRWEEITRLHEGGVKFPFDENLVFRLNVRGLNLPGKAGDASVLFGISYRFDKGRVVSELGPTPPASNLSPREQEGNKRLFSYLLPLSREEKGPLFRLILKFKPDEESLSRRNQEVLQSLFDYLKGKEGTIVLLTGKGGASFERRKSMLLRYLMQKGKLDKNSIKTEKGSLDGLSWVEVSIEETDASR
ncbi:MAG TPA: hypothetical protein PLT64_03515 [Syntrophales bacterium]|nr:hypothetical protein [Syntrophales bacterium]HOL58918.1 hypothetical protein [Syntrophales bacterium]HPO35245.1 hypothetical protein [Syntrophales bacterium]